MSMRSKEQGGAREAQGRRDEPVALVTSHIWVALGTWRQGGGESGGGAGGAAGDGARRAGG